MIEDQNEMEPIVQGGFKESLVYRHDDRRVHEERRMNTVGALQNCCTFSWLVDDRTTYIDLR